MPNRYLKTKTPLTQPARPSQAKVQRAQPAQQVQRAQQAQQTIGRAKPIIFFGRAHPIALSLLLISAALGGCSDKKAQEQKWTELLTKEVTATVMPKLMNRLMAQLKNGNYAQAVKFCRGFAPSTERSWNSRFARRKFKDIPVKDISFKRTSLKVRNPKNSPDKFERAQLEKWQAQQDKAGPGKQAAEVQLTVFKEGDTWYGMYPLWIVSDKCLACHGQPKVRDKEATQVINKAYPKDKAIGYKLMDLRGAMSIQVRYDQK